MNFIKKEIRLKDGTECILRSPNEDDAAGMIEYLKVTTKETHFMQRYPEEVIITLEAEKEIIKKTLDSKNGIMIAAFINGELVGNAGLTSVMDFIKTKHRAYFGISIKEKYWNKGIGNALIKEILEQAKKVGYEQIELGVFSDNVKAQNLYKKYGFEVWGSMKNTYKLKDNTYRDEILMGKVL